MGRSFVGSRWGVARIALAAILLVGADHAEEPLGPNVLLISIDTLRADHVHAYGYARRTTPNLDRLAARGVLFETAVADTSWTLPSHVTLLTGLPSRVHQVTYDGIRLDEARQTLAELLSRAGYRTRAVVSAPYLHPIFGFGQGFERYRVVGETVYDQDDYALGKTQSDQNWFQKKLRWERVFHESRTSDEVARLVEAELRELKDERFFLFVHLFDPHHDYDPPERYWRRFDPDYEGDLDPSDYSFNPRIRPDMPPRELQHVIARYDGEILWTDEHVGSMLDALDRLGLATRTLVVATSDHGEEFFEHGKKGHRETLFDEQLLVPLILRWPARLPRGKRLKSQVRLSDVAPTILDLAGLPPGEEMMGRSLVPFIEGREASVDLPALSTLVYPNDVFWQALRTPDWKLIRIQTPGSVGRRIRLFFDLRADAAEQKTLRAPHRRAAAARELERLVAEADAWRERLPSNAPAAVSLPPEMRRALEALGYVEAGGDPN